MGETDPAQIWTFKDTDSLAAALAEYVHKAAKESVAEHGNFSVAISGGSLVKALSKIGDAAGVAAPEWSKWHVFWADERVVPLDHPDSNYAAALAPFLSKIALPKDQIHSIADTSDAVAAAEKYDANLRELASKKVIPVDSEGYPRLDLILLGVGPDGHIASLFPKHPLLRETTKWVAPILDSPKPPPSRITLTLPVINAASRVAVVTTGSSKAAVLKRVFGKREEPGDLPAQQVSGKGRDFIWFMDTEASSSL